MTDNSTDQVQGSEAAGSAGQAMAESEGTSAGNRSSIAESISALIDSEASELEVRRILKAAESDPNVRAQWQRYQLVHSVLQREGANPKLDLSERISAAIAEEPALNADESRESSHKHSRIKSWRSGLGKVAIAASVAFAFIVGVQQMGPGAVDAPAQDIPAQIVDSAQPAAGQPSVNTVPTGFELPPFAARTVSTGTQAPVWTAPQFSVQYPQSAIQAQLEANQALQNYFERLLLKHAERASSNGGMGLLPFARISRLEMTEKEMTEKAAAEKAATENNAAEPMRTQEQK